MGDPHLRYPSIHVAGTNGKGTVCHMVEEALRASGCRTGLYTSPHLIEFTERVRLDGAPIAREPLMDAARALWPAIEDSGATFFEATTAVAFLAMADAGVDVAVVEVGLGGRLDATNVLTPEVCAITRIDLDHAAYLGDTLADVAAEKAGILEPGVPAVIAAGQHPEAMETLLRVAEEVGASVTIAEPLPEPTVMGPGRWVAATDSLRDVPLAPALPGAHHVANAAVAAHVLAALPEALRPSSEAAEVGISRAEPPGRFQRLRARGVDWILDAAHNPAGAAALARTLVQVGPTRPLVAVVAIVADKDWPAMLDALAPAVDHMVLTGAPGVPEERRWDPARAGAGRRLEDATVAEDFGAALEEAARRAGQGGGLDAGGSAPGLLADAPGTVLVMGSFHTVGAGLEELRD